MRFLLVLAAVLVVSGCSSPTVPDKVSAVTVDPATVALEVRADGTSDYAILTPSVSPSTATDPSVTWTSSAPAVATVNPTTSSAMGVIVQPAAGVFSGTASVTATSNDGTSITSNPVSVTIWSIAGNYTSTAYPGVTLALTTAGAWNDGTSSGTFSTVSGTVSMIDGSGNIYYEGTYTQTGFSLTTTNQAATASTWVKQ